MDSLFDPTRYQVAPDLTEGLSPDRRRTVRQLAALRAGRHPLGLPRRVHLKLHADAPDPDNRDAAGPRCGDCRFREFLRHRGKSYPKCLLNWDREPQRDPPLASHGAATDCRAWWPACEHWEPKP